MNPEAIQRAQSAQARLLRHAQELGVDPNLILNRFASERFLYRLSISPHADRFVLKGALLLLAWLGETLRPTRDADFLGFGDLSDSKLERIFQEICVMPTEVGCMTYYPESIEVAHCPWSR